MLEVKDLVVRYGPLEALHGVSMTVGEGEFVAVLGRNGAGKSTLVRAIAGVTHVHSGSITYRRRRIDNRSPRSIVGGGIAVVPEGRQLFGGLSVLDNITLGCYGVIARGAGGFARSLLPTKTVVGHRVERVITLIPELADLLKRQSAKLSGGQQQMVALGRALIAEPSILIVDELSLGLAPLVVKRLLQQLLSLQQSGTSIVLIEQNIRLSLETAERAYVIDGGKVCYSGNCSDLAESRSVLATYLGVEGTHTV